MKRLTIALLFLLMAQGCVAKSGAEEIKTDRDTCDMCHMAITDLHYAAEIRGGKDKVLRRFDDFGCAITFAAEHGLLAEAGTEIWAADSTSTGAEARWLDARKAFFVSNQHTPMNYGYAAVPGQAPGALTFDETVAALTKGAAPHHHHMETAE